MQTGFDPARGVAAPPPTHRERLRQAMLRFQRARVRLDAARSVLREAQDEDAAAESVVKDLLANPASVDTRPKDEDPAQTGASLASGAVGEAETPNL